MVAREREIGEVEGCYKAVVDGRGLEKAGAGFSGEGFGAVSALVRVQEDVAGSFQGFDGELGSSGRRRGGSVWAMAASFSLGAPAPRLQSGGPSFGSDALAASKQGALLGLKAAGSPSSGSAFGEDGEAIAAGFGARHGLPAPSSTSPPSCESLDVNASSCLMIVGSGVELRETGGSPVMEDGGLRHGCLERLPPVCFNAPVISEHVFSTAALAAVGSVPEFVGADPSITEMASSRAASVAGTADMEDRAIN